MNTSSDARPFARGSASSTFQVFLSCSGRRSELAAAALKRFLEGVFKGPGPPIVPFLYSEDTEPGRPGVGEVRARLRSASYGVLCLTVENQLSPWMMFEAGAIAKDTVEGRIVPFLVDERGYRERGPFNPRSFKSVTADQSSLQDLVDGIAAAAVRSAPRLEKYEASVRKLVRTIAEIRRSGTLAPQPLARLIDNCWRIEAKELPFHRWLRNQLLNDASEAIRRLERQTPALGEAHGWDLFENEIRKTFERQGAKPVRMLALCGQKPPEKKPGYYDLFFARALELARENSAFVRLSLPRAMADGMLRLRPCPVTVCRVFVTAGAPAADDATHIENHEKLRTLGVRGLEVPRDSIGDLYRRFPGLAERLKEGFGFVIFDLPDGASRRRLVIAHEGVASQHAMTVIEDPASVRKIVDLFVGLAEQSEQMRSHKPAEQRTRKRLQELLAALRSGG